ncbi:MAG: sigma-70 family RNA polymerase sigma factor [Lachnospiraceae bacterium]|nr:sigma-70 family RNA polymerase sigma factor [Lachnospiraceae bacterium]
MKQKTDQEIIALFFERDESAILETEKKYKGYCLSVAHNILGDAGDAEECVSETWWKAWKAIPPARPKVLKLFLAKITRNLAFDLYRKNRAEKRNAGVTLSLEELQECTADTADTPERIMEAEEMRESINRFLRALPERECDVFLRRYFFGENIRTIAGEYVLKEANVRKILSRTRGKLADFLRKEEWVDEKRDAV